MANRTSATSAATTTTSTTNLETKSSAASGNSTIGALPGKPTTPVQVLNPQFPAYANFEAAWKAGNLHPYEGAAVGRYFGIGKAYDNSCQYNSDYYAIRSGRYIRRA